MNHPDVIACFSMSVANGEPFFSVDWLCMSLWARLFSSLGPHSYAGLLLFTTNNSIISINLLT